MERHVRFTPVPFKQDYFSDKDRQFDKYVDLDINQLKKSEIDSKIQ